MTTKIQQQKVMQLLRFWGLITHKLDGNVPLSGLPHRRGQLSEVQNSRYCSASGNSAQFWYIIYESNGHHNKQLFVLIQMHGICLHHKLLQNCSRNN